MAKKSYGGSQQSNQSTTPQQNKEPQSLSAKIIGAISTIGAIALIGSFVLFVILGNKSDGDAKGERTREVDTELTTEFVTNDAETDDESTEELIDETIDENDPFKVGIFISTDDNMGHHFSYNKETNNFINDDDQYDIIKCKSYDVNDSDDADDTDDIDITVHLYDEVDEKYVYYIDYGTSRKSINVSEYTCSTDMLSQLKQDGFLLDISNNEDCFGLLYKYAPDKKYIHYSYIQTTYFANSESPYIDGLTAKYTYDIYGNLVEEYQDNTDGVSHYTEYPIECWVPDCLIDYFNALCKPNTGDDVKSFVNNYCYYAYVPNNRICAKSDYFLILSKDYVTNGFIFNDYHYSFNGADYVNDENSDDVLSEVPEEVLERTKALYEEYGFNYQGYHHSYNSKDDKWICDDNSAVSYDYDSIPADIDIVWLDESL